MTLSTSPSSLDPLELTPPAAASGGPRRRRLALLSGSVVALLGVSFLVGYVPRQQRQAALVQKAAARASALPAVVTVTPVPSQAERTLSLPGSVEPLETAHVHSRASGFVTEWLADMGDHVAAGQLLARLDTPELDREIQQARATLQRADAAILQARATAEYSASTHRRYSALAPEGVVSQQELTQYEAQAHVDAANIRVAQAERAARAADLERLEQLERFGRIVAPFAGTVSARRVERGALVTAGAGGPLFEIVVTDPLRVFVQVPQSLVADVKPGQSVQVTVNEYPGLSFAGTLTRASGTLDPESRTMRVEVQVPNPDGKLLPGMYANLATRVKRGRRSFLVPATAIVHGAEGPRVAVVEAAGTVRLLGVEVERDLGAEVEIKHGLNGTESVIRAPGPQIRDGAVVEVTSQKGREK